MFKLIPNSFSLLLFSMTSLSNLIEKDSSVLKMRRDLSAFAFKKLFENHSKSTFPTSSFSRVTSTFSEHTYRVLSSA